MTTVGSKQNAKSQNAPSNKQSSNQAPLKANDPKDTLTLQQKLQLCTKANEIYRNQLQYMQDHLVQLRSQIQSKENVIENLMLRYDLGIISQDQNTTDYQSTGATTTDEMEKLTLKAKALANCTILENFSLRETVNGLRDQNFHLRNDVYELGDKINTQQIQINKFKKHIATNTNIHVVQDHNSNAIGNDVNGIDNNPLNVSYNDHVSKDAVSDRKMLKDSDLLWMHDIQWDAALTEVFSFVGSIASKNWLRKLEKPHMNKVKEIKIEKLQFISLLSSSIRIENDTIIPNGVLSTIYSYSKCLSGNKTYDTSCNDLHKMVNIDDAEKLLQNGNYYIDQWLAIGPKPSNYFFTPLILAYRVRDVELVEFFVLNGARRNIRSLVDELKGSTTNMDSNIRKKLLEALSPFYEEDPLKNTIL